MILADKTPLRSMRGVSTSEATQVVPAGCCFYRRLPRLSWVAVAALVLLGAAPPRATCRPDPADIAWRDRALSNWRVAERRLLHLAPAPLPMIVLVDAHCTYTAEAGAPGRARWAAAPHGDRVVLPGGNKAPMGPISFATAESGGYFAMSLPSVWRAAGVTSGLGLERLMDGVMLHELMHTRQFYFANPSLADLTHRFGDALFAAAAAPSDAEARAMAAKALALMQARRARWFTGDEARWLPLDDMFLTMEGLGQWLAYAWYRTPAGGSVDAPRALQEVRRGGRHWTQDEGLALFLVVDRLVPDWQRAAFAPKPLLAEALLAKAARPG